MKTIMITGAGRGIGRAIAIETAKHFASKGESLNLAICSRTGAELEETKKEASAFANVLALNIDISDPSGLEMLAGETRKAFGSIDVLINNAGIARIGLLQDMTLAEMQSFIQTDLTSAMQLSSIVIPDLLKSSHSPRIINISSVWGICGASCETVYSAAKGGLNAFTKALARELAPSHIPVNAICCGYIDTSMNDHLSEEEKAAVLEQIPAGRFGTTEDIAKTVVQLLEATDYLTGQLITVDGGWT